MKGLTEKLLARAVKSGHFEEDRDLPICLELARVAERHSKGRFVLIHIHKGIIYAVRIYGSLEAAIRAGKRLAKAEGFSEEVDEIDVWKAGDSEASWQYREDDSFPAPGEPRLRWK